MRTKTIVAVLAVGAIIQVFAAPAKAQEKKAAPQGENTLALCQDKADNDGDKYVDCEDQDCGIFAICVTPPVAPTVAEANALADQTAADVSAPPVDGPVPGDEIGELCSDGLDNDGDNAIDCADPSCHKVPWCHIDTEAKEKCHDNIDNDGDGLLDCQEPSCAHNPHCMNQPEEGRRCRDNIDNDKNGLVDCDEPACFETRKCRRLRYYVPEPADKPVGLLLSFGGGLALPNWRRPTARTPVSQRYGVSIPFRPDVGLSLNLMGAYLITKWMGFGVNANLFGTGGMNRADWEEHSDPYKYQGVKLSSHLGGFARFQYPFKRFVPYLDIGVGYSYAQYRWWVYNNTESWDDIVSHDEDHIEGPEDRYKTTFRHLTVALQPGFDIFLRARSVAIGLRAWLPVFASQDARTDNISIVLNATFTPQWREKPTLKPQYQPKPQ